MGEILVGRKSLRSLQMISALFHDTDVVKHIITSQCEVDVRNHQGLTPLHFAASVGSNAVCERLLKGGADINCINTQCKVTKSQQTAITYRVHI